MTQDPDGRLILIGGVGGAGTTTMCAATAQELHDGGRRAVVLDGTALGDTPPSVLAMAVDGAGRILVELGADPLSTEAWAALPGMAQLSLLARAAELLADPGVDVVVVDAGSLPMLRDLVRIPALLLNLLDATLTPRLAMWRSDLTARHGVEDSDADTDGASLFDAMSSVRAELLRIQRIVDGALARLVTTPEPEALDRTARAAALLSVLGVSVDGVIVNRFPRRSQKQARRVAKGQLSVLAERVAPVAVWSSGRTLRPSPTVAHPTTASARTAPVSIPRVTAEHLQVEPSAAGDQFLLRIPLLAPARDTVRVGVQGDQLVLALDGVMRWVDLPAALRRCHPVEAVRTPDGLEAVFAPDPALWPGRSAA